MPTYREGPRVSQLDNFRALDINLRGDIIARVISPVMLLPFGLKNDLWPPISTIWKPMITNHRSIYIWRQLGINWRQTQIGLVVPVVLLPFGLKNDLWSPISVPWSNGRQVSTNRYLRPPHGDRPPMKKFSRPSVAIC